MFYYLQYLQFTHYKSKGYPVFYFIIFKKYNSALRFTLHNYFKLSILLCGLISFESTTFCLKVHLKLVSSVLFFFFSAKFLNFTLKFYPAYQVRLQNSWKLNHIKFTCRKFPDLSMFAQCVLNQILGLIQFHLLDKQVNLF